MRVRMLVDASGTRNGQPWPARGEEIDLPDGEAVGYCQAGLCEPVADTGRVETATAPAPETREDASSAGNSKGTSARGSKSGSSRSSGKTGSGTSSGS